MIQVKCITTMKYGEAGTRQREVVSVGYVNPASISAIVPLPARDIWGEYHQVSRIYLNDGPDYVEVAETPEEINKRMPICQ